MKFEDAYDTVVALKPILPEGTISSALAILGEVRAELGDAWTQGVCNESSTATLTSIQADASSTAIWLTWVAGDATMKVACVRTPEIHCELEVCSAGYTDPRGVAKTLAHYARGVKIETLERELAETKEQVRDLAKGALLEEMSCVSEAEWFASWMHDLEYRLWKRVLDGEAPALLMLAKQAGGWWRWSDDHEAEIFVPLDQWNAEYARRGNLI